MTARAADLGPHSKTVARIGQGLAPALTDNQLQVLGAPDPSDSRTHEIRVWRSRARLARRRATKLSRTCQHWRSGRRAVTHSGTKPVALARELIAAVSGEKLRPDAPPGWRFLIAPGHEDVWFDASLLGR